MAFYDIFDYLCKQKGISPTGVARENGISQQTVSQWKKRGSTPNAQTVNKLADYFNIPVEHLLAFSSKKEIDRIDDMAARVSKLSGIPKEEIMELDIRDMIDNGDVVVFNNAEAAADKAVISQFRGVPDAYLKDVIDDSLRRLNRRGRIEAALRLIELSETSRFSK